MRFFHLSDLHIGLRLMNRDLSEDQAFILHQIVEYAVREKPDAIVIAGDIYDKAIPSADAVELFDQFIQELTEGVPEAYLMLISGNHDSGPRLDCFRSVLSRQHIYMIGMPPQTPEEFIQKVSLRDDCGWVDFYLLPFVKPSMVKPVIGSREDGINFSYDETVQKILAREELDPTRRNVLVSHQFYLPAGKEAGEVERMESEIRTVGNIDEVSAAVLAPFDYAALGHIHKPMTVGRACCRYSGTPLACSVSEAGQEKGIVMVELGEKGTDPVIQILPLKPLRQVKQIRGSLEEILASACEDYVSVVLTDAGDPAVTDLAERLRITFPRLLEIQRETRRMTAQTEAGERIREADPLELCLSFLPDLDEKEQDILKDVIRKIQEAESR